jgi:hypothetical protein
MERRLAAVVLVLQQRRVHLHDAPGERLVPQRVRDDVEQRLAVRCRLAKQQISIPVHELFSFFLFSEIQPLFPRIIYDFVERNLHGVLRQERSRLIERIVIFVVGIAVLLNIDFMRRHLLSPG